MKLGPLVGAGVRSHVYALDSKRVVKVPRVGTPDSWIRKEAEFTASVHALGVPVPAVHELTIHGGRAVVVYERIYGPSMWASVAGQPSSAHAMGQMLADLQLALFVRPAPMTFPRQRDRLACKIRMSTNALGAEFDALVASLPSSSDALVLCHGDLHPGNVILSPSGPIVLDWFDVSRGIALADVARSSILMGAGGRIYSSLRHFVPLDHVALRAVHDSYLEVMRDRLPVLDETRFLKWVQVGAAARLAEGVGTDDLLRLAQLPDG